MMRKGQAYRETLRGQGLGRGKVGMQGLLPGVPFGEEVEVGRDLE